MPPLGLWAYGACAVQPSHFHSGFLPHAAPNTAPMAASRTPSDCLAPSLPVSRMSSDGSALEALASIEASPRHP